MCVLSVVHGSISGYKYEVLDINVLASLPSAVLGAAD